MGGDRKIPLGMVNIVGGIQACLVLVFFGQV